MDSGRTTVRNMRSKCRCSYVLQFTFRRAVCCVLHRPPSQVIHCTVLFLNKLKVGTVKARFAQSTVDISSRGGRAKKNSISRRRLFKRLAPYRESSRRSRGICERTIEVLSRLRAASRPPADEPAALGDGGSQKSESASPRGVELPTTESPGIDNDPSAGSPTETLLRLLLPLNAQVWESSRTATEACTCRRSSPNTSLKRSIGSSDGRCVQRAGT